MNLYFRALGAVANANRHVDVIFDKSGASDVGQYECKFVSWTNLDAPIIPVPCVNPPHDSANALQKHALMYAAKWIAEYSPATHRL